MPLSKEFYLDEIRSKHPNSYNESLKDLPVKDLADMLDFLDEALGKADGGAIGIEVLFTEKEPRKNFFMGGPALEGQALSVYNSMNAYGFSDQEIADALKARGLYDVAPAVETPVTNTATNIINQGGGGGGSGGGGITTFDKGFSSQNFGLGPNKDVVDYEAEAYGIGPTFKGQVARAFSALSNIPTPFNIARMGIQKAIDFTKQKAAEKKAQEEAIARDNFREAMKQGRGFYDQFGKGDAASSKSREEAGSGFSDVSESGPFKDGGLATMFRNKR